MTLQRLLFCIPLITLLGAASSSAETITVVGSNAHAVIGIAGVQQVDVEPVMAQASVTYTNLFNGVSANGTSVADISAGHLGAAESSNPPLSQSGAAQADFELSIETDEVLAEPVWVLMTINGALPNGGAQADLIVGNQVAAFFCFPVVGCKGSGSLGNFGSNVLALPFIESTNIEALLKVGGSDFNFLSSADVKLIIPAGVTIHDSTGFFNNTLPSTVPEPSTLMLVGTGLLSFGPLLRRRIRLV